MPRERRFPTKSNCKVCLGEFIAKCPKHIYCGSWIGKTGCAHKQRVAKNRKHAKTQSLFRKAKYAAERAVIAQKINPLLLSKNSTRQKSGKVVRCCVCQKEVYRKRQEIVKNPTCSYKCFGLRQRKRIKRVCATCFNEFEVSPSAIKWAKIRKRNLLYCSVKCRGVAFRGSKSPMWIKDRSLVKYRPNGNADHGEWREKVFKRDDYTCQLCKKRGNYLEAHHIKRWVDYPDLRFEISNGVTLCRDCHNSVKGREDILEYLLHAFAIANGLLVDRGLNPNKFRYQKLSTPNEMGEPDVL